MASIPFIKILTSTCVLVSLLLLLQPFLVKCDGGEEYNSGSGNEDQHSKGLVLVEVWCLIILLVNTFPGRISQYLDRWNESFLLLGTQFAAGLFLGTSLMHFLSDSAGTFRDVTTKTYPFALMLASAGYLLTVLGDCIVLLVTSSSKKEARVEVEEGRTGAEHDHQEDEDGVSPVLLKTTSFGDTILLIIPLCFHSVFEGIAVGVAGIL